jgi:hypothetical protein
VGDKNDYPSEREKFLAKTLKKDEEDEEDEAVKRERGKEGSEDTGLKKLQ